MLLLRSDIDSTVIRSIPRTGTRPSFHVKHSLSMYSIIIICIRLHENSNHF